MVLEALAAVSLAGNVVQFVDFSCRLFSTAASIRRSTTGAAESIQDLDTVTQALRHSSEKIASSRNTAAQQGVTQDHSSLVKLADNCQTAATELLSVTQALKTKDSGSKWSSFKAALATAWSEKEIKDMESRLNAYRQQMHLEVSLLQSEDHKRMWESLDKLESSTHQTGENTLKQVLRLRTEIVYALATLRRDMSEAKSDILREFDFTNRIQGDTTGLYQHTYAGITTMLVNCQSKASDMVVALTILNTLTFEQMRSRHGAVSEAHPGTFEWVFTNKFSAWLRSPDPIFWISGKPGSGKSTLMKYLIGHPNTPIALNDWSRPHRLVIADYFFWINGTALQRSLEGLLRALLYDILRQTPKLVKELLPEAWESAREHLAIAIPNMPWTPPEWTRETLMSAFQRLSVVEEMTTKFCVFIDGLDEYSGDHRDLVQTIRHLNTIGVKLCAASRPWNIFEGAFGGDETQKLYLQELNKPDIKHYVDEKLRTHPEFASVELIHAEKIITDVIEKSQGVFLWVRLAVGSLEEGLNNHDPASLLRERLEEFPSDLTEFFQHMFISLQKIYRPHLSHMFQMALTVIEPLSPVAFWCLDEIDEHPNFAFTLPIHATEVPKTAQIVKEMTIRINGRSRGLLEVTNSTQFDSTPDNQHEAYVEARVDFLHRTVKDFITTTEIHAMLSTWQKPHFDADLTLCNVMLANFKIVAFTPRALDGPSTLKKLLKQFFTSAARIEQGSHKSIIVQIEELERIAVEYSRLQPLQRYGIWELLNCSSLLSVALIYDMRNLFVERLRWNAIPKEEVAETARLVLLNNKLWKKHSDVNDPDADGLSDHMKSLLSTNPPLETHSEFEDALFSRLSQLEPTVLISIVKAFARRTIINSETIDEWVWKKRLTDKLSVVQYEELQVYVSAASLAAQSTAPSANGPDSTVGPSPLASQVDTPTIVLQGVPQSEQQPTSDVPDTTTRPRSRSRSIRENMKRLSRRFRE
ncbi:hypothetical protein CC86DRAFT_378654 [Ophiobolus disseminans]|uniref:NACHT domain-containing protein n=1 Tax=Ophiobolus disseminans TaxID=1469910 RepID=A0A6A7AAQ9_9PLEO|nr:hypothetical protein CC86DRAFT_378654 [Ophiobolus disseminans]